ncbi:hypothetical protein JOL79_29905 [Microbispora sp. RL4-1S]|uniref:Uncharacterized protein n=1 Tax=Microbispora oryzae TaxID=2806554 RepID=A0A940WQB9_9ACTN|nr:hypothetical protein [Microbispora oryzae]MBP2708002.1 hypothetical protein [Microbispora oryzae]
MLPLAAGATGAAAVAALLALRLAGHDGAAALAVTVWSSAWIPPLALMQLAASAAIRTGGRAPWTHQPLILAIIAVTLANSLLSTPSDPFAGLPTIAPESWRTVLKPLGGLATLLGASALLLIPITLWRAALGSAESARARIGVAAAGTTSAPLTVCFCLMLAIARDPGAVEPSLGSVAFLVALAGSLSRS